MHLHKSLYPAIPDVPPRNFHHLLFHRPDQKEWNLDYTVHIDAMTRKRRSYREFYELVMDGATALGSPISEQGLGLDGTDGEIVGILSENCMVGVGYRPYRFLTAHSFYGAELYYIGAFTAGNHNAVRSPFILLHNLRTCPRPPPIQGDMCVCRS